MGEAGYRAPNHISVTFQIASLAGRLALEMAFNKLICSGGEDLFMDPLHRSRVKEMDIVEIVKRALEFGILIMRMMHKSFTSGKTSHRRPRW